MSGPQADDRFNLIQVAVRVGFSCAITAGVAVAAFFVTRFMAGVG